MADNITIKDGASADQVVACDEVTRNATTEKQQIVKIGLGAEGAHDTLVDSGQQTMANSLPVVLASDQASIPVAATLAAETTKVIGTINIASGQGVTAAQGTAANLKAEVSNAGTFAVQDSQMLADDAAFTPATSKVVPVGCLADDTSTDLVDEGDIGAPRMTLDRRPIVQLGESGANQVKGGGSKTDTTDQSVMAAGGAGVYNYLACVTLYNSSATNTYANIKDGATVVAVVPLPAYGGAIFQPAHALRGSANTAWNVAAGASVTTAYFYGFGYKASA